MEKTIKPPCATWKAWLGREIEGHIQLGVPTLFVRNADVLKLLKEYPEIRRVWLCKEFLEGRSQEALDKVCGEIYEKRPCINIAVEVMLSTLEQYAFLRRWAMLYVKWPTELLRAGDHICVGPAFNDEAFCIGEGHKVTPLDYLGDVQLC